MHLYEVVENLLPTLMKETGHQGVPFVLAEPFQVPGRVDASQVRKMRGELRIYRWRIGLTLEECFQLFVPLQVLVDRPNLRRWWGLLETLEERALIRVICRENLIQTSSQLGAQVALDPLEEILLCAGTDVDDESLQGRRGWADDSTPEEVELGSLDERIWKLACLCPRSQPVLDVRAGSFVKAAKPRQVEQV